LNENPKDLVGRKKVALLSVLSSASILHEARAMNHGAHRALKVDGSRGYGPFNWRGNKVLASIYVDACMRHLLSWFDGEENADDSGIHHLGHAKACLGILLDAIETGNLVDDRPPKGKAAEILERWREKPIPDAGPTVGDDPDFARLRKSIQRGLKRRRR
jgi:hypothetical protein